MLSPRFTLFFFSDPLEDFKCLNSYELGKDNGFGEHQELLRRLLTFKHGGEIFLNGQNISNIKVTPNLDLWIDVDDQIITFPPDPLPFQASSSSIDITRARTY